MGIYYCLLVGTILLGAALKPEKNVGRRAAFLGIAFVVLSGISGFRYSVGYDYSYGYAPHYQMLLENPQYTLKDIKIEPAYALLEKATTFLSQNYQMIFVTTSILMIALFMFYYYKTSPNAAISVFIFLGLCQYYCSMNLTRNTFAAIICMYAVPFLKKRKIIPYMLIILIAATFHKSALLLIVFYFVNLIPVKKYVLAAYGIVTAIIYFNTEKIMAFVTQYWYSGYTAQSEHVTIGFEWPFAIAELSLFLFLFFFSNRLTKKDPRNYVYVNYAFFSFFFTLMGIRHAILDRFGLYFVLAYPVSIAMILMDLREDYKEKKQSVGRKQKLELYPAMLALVFGGIVTFHGYSLHMDHHGVVPYRLIFNQPFYSSYAEGLKLKDEEKSDDYQDKAAEEPFEEPFEEPLKDKINPDKSENPDQESLAYAELPQNLPEGAPVPVDMEEFLSRN